MGILSKASVVVNPSHYHGNAGGIDFESFQPEVIENSSRELDDYTDALTLIGDVQEGFEQYEAFVSNAISRGGLDASAAEALDIGMNILTRRWVQGAVMPSTESYSYSGGRLQASTEAFEGIRDTLRSIWENIKMFVKKWVDAALRFYQNNLSAASRLESAAKALATKAREKTGSKDKDEVTVSYSVFKNLSIDFVDPTESSILNGLTAMEEAVKKYSKNAATVKELDSFKDTIKGFKVSNKAGMEATLLKLKNNKPMDITTVAASFTSFNGSISPTRHTSTSTIKYLIGNNLLGNVMPVFIVSGEEVIGDDAETTVIVTGISFKMEPSKEDEKEPNTTPKIPAINGSSVVDLANKAASLATQVRLSNTDTRNCDEKIKDLEKILDGLVSDIRSSEVEKENKELYNYINACVRGYSKWASALLLPATSLQKQALASVSASISYGNSCLGNLKKS